MTMSCLFFRIDKGGSIVEQKGRAVLFALGAFFLMAFVQSLCSSLIADFSGVQAAGQQRALTLGVAALILIAAILAGEKALPLFPRQWIGGRLGVPLTVCCFVFGAAANLTLASILSLMPFSQEFLTEYMQAVPLGKGGAAWVELTALCLLAPIMEELLFRGVILHSLAQAFPLQAAVLMECLLFAWGHGQILWFLYALAMGLTLTLIAWKTRSLRASIAFHIAFNAANYLQPLLTAGVGDGPAALLGIAAAGLVLCAAAVYMLCRVPSLSAGK